VKIDEELIRNIVVDSVRDCRGRSSYVLWFNS